MPFVNKSKDRLHLAAAAKFLQVSHAAIQNWERSGLIKRGDDNLFAIDDLIAVAETRRKGAKTKAAVTSAVRPQTNVTNNDDGEESYADAVARKARAEADISEMKAEELAKSLVRVSELEPKLCAVFAAFREAILQIPARVDSVLAAELDRANVNNILSQELETALRQLTNPYS